MTAVRWVVEYRDVPGQAPGPYWEAYPDRDTAVAHAGTAAVWALVPAGWVDVVEAAQKYIHHDGPPLDAVDAEQRLATAVARLAEETP